jgi:hypothetical protein
MSVINNNLLLTAPAAASATGVSRSLRFNGSVDSSYLSRTPASAPTSTRKFTYSTWVKRSAFGSYQGFSLAATGRDGIYFTDTDAVAVFFAEGVQSFTYTQSLFRDPSAWYHFVISIDTTQATAANRIAIYVNNVLQPLTGTYPSQNYDFTNFNASGKTQSIGYALAGSQYFNGYLAEIYCIDGQALDPTSFTETDATTGQLIPKAFSGSYGTNGFHLTFEDNSSNTATTLGKDTSGNGNNFTPSNLSVTAGAGNDSLVDVPNNGSQVDSGIGGEVRGNYCTLNPLKKGSSLTLANGNLDQSGSGQFQHSTSTFAVSSGKWYFEVTHATGEGNSVVGLVGQTSLSQNLEATNYLGQAASHWGYYANGQLVSNSSLSGAWGTDWSATGAIVGVAFDADTGKIWFSYNGTWQASGNPAGGTNPAYTASSYGVLCPGGRTFSSGALTFNFGQRSWAYNAPSGFKALCTANLPAPLVTKPNTVFDVLAWSGSGGARSFTSFGFSPDLVWGKQRNGANSHQIYDIVRGAGNNKDLASDLTAAEGSATTSASAYGYLSSFDSAGFSVANGTDGTYGAGYWNMSGRTYVAWCWDAGSSTVTNTQGSITSSVRANATAGFSVVTYTGSGANSTIGHGLGVAPQLIITKSRSSSFNWGVYHASAGNSVYGKLNLTDAFSALAIWQNTTPTSSVFYVGNYNAANQQSDNYVAYCFAPVVGYSSMGSYVGNGSSDGVFVYTGMRPRWIMTKPSSSEGAWLIHDTSRDPYNVSNLELQANASSAEYNTSGAGAGDRYDILSNGFKHRTGNAGANGSGTTYIYAAFAESPFNYARAR